MLHHIGLFFHIAAIIVVAGGSVGSMLAEAQLWAKLNSSSGDEKAVLPILMNAPKLIIAGVIVFLLSGLTMLYAVNWAYLSQPWFIAKLLLFISLPVRGAVIGKSTIMHIAAELNKPHPDRSILLRLKAKMQRFHIIQFIIVAVIVILVIFKF